MNDRDGLLDQRDDLVRALRELNNAAGDARSYVYAALGLIVKHEDSELEGDTRELLDRLDGALADAGDLLARVRS
jgi:hypothetical protein